MPCHIAEGYDSLSLRLGHIPEFHCLHHVSDFARPGWPWVDMFSRRIVAPRQCRLLYGLSLDGSARAVGRLARGDGDAPCGGIGSYIIQKLTYSVIVMRGRRDSAGLGPRACFCIPTC